MTDFKCAGVGYLVHDTFYESRFSFAVLAYECYFFATFDGECRMVKYLMVAISLAYIVGYNRIIARAWCRRKFQIEMRGVHLIDFDAVYFGQLFDAALHLHALGGFVAESLDKVFGFLDHLLLILKSSHLLFETFLTQSDIFGIVDRVVIYLSERNLYGTVGHIVDKRAVVAHEHHRVGLGHEKVLKPLD